MDGNSKPITRILQLGIVVPDLKKAVESFEILGISPWQRDDGLNDVLSDREVDGITCEYEFLAAFATVGDLEIELIQPIDEKSDYAKYLKNNTFGGIHHIAIEGENQAFAHIIEVMDKPVLQSGYWKGFGKYRYYDFRDSIGTILEVYDYE